MTIKRRKGYFSISAVAEMFSIHQQTIRLYEKEGLIAPKRSDGNTRMFSEEDIDRLEEVIYLTHELGINLAGVQMILKLQKQIKKMQQEMNAVFNQAQSELTQEVETTKKRVEHSARRLLEMKKPGLTDIQKKESHAVQEVNEPEETEWQIDYEE